jgi:hypothetical protein
MRPVHTVFAAACAAGLLTLAAAPAVAHHSFGHYAMDKTAEIEGVVSKWEWGNPHCWLFVDVAAAGKTTTYGFELQSPGELMRRGWKRTSIKHGDKLKVQFRPMKDGTPAGLMARVTDAQGKVIGNASPNAGGAPVVLPKAN